MRISDLLNIHPKLAAPKILDKFQNKEELQEGEEEE